jgi:hypothetical protein
MYSPGVHLSVASMTLEVDLSICKLFVSHVEEVLSHAVWEKTRVENGQVIYPACVNNVSC